MVMKSRPALFLTLLVVGLVISAALTASLWSLLGAAPLEKAAAGRHSSAVESTLAFPDKGGPCEADALRSPLLILTPSVSHWLDVFRIFRKRSGSMTLVPRCTS